MKTHLNFLSLTMKKQESPTISTLLVLSLFIFLSTIEVEARVLQQICSSSCGDLTNITYPFRLTTDPVKCGDPDYQISCQDNKPILEFHSGKYFVKQISYDRHIIRLVDINLANGSCNLPYKSVSINEVKYDSRYRGLVSSTFASFFRCSSEINDPAYRKVPCLSGNGSHFYVSYGTYIISDLQGYCSFTSRVPTIYQAVWYPSYESILELMALGFDLEWSVECRDCIADGGSCSLSSLGTPNIYECHFSGWYSFFLQLLSNGVRLCFLICAGGDLIFHFLCGCAGIHVPPLVSSIIYAIWDILLGNYPKLKILHLTMWLWCFWTN